MYHAKLNAKEQEWVVDKLLSSLKASALDDDKDLINNLIAKTKRAQKS